MRTVASLRMSKTHRYQFNYGQHSTMLQQKTLLEYSQVSDCQIAFDRSQQKKLQLPDREVLEDLMWNTRSGVEAFRPSSEQPRIKNLLLSVVKYEVEHKQNPDMPAAQILCESSLLRDIASDCTATYDVVYFHGQLIFARRPGVERSAYLTFSKARFKDLMCTDDPSTPTISDRRHYGVLAQGTLVRKDSSLPDLTMLVDVPVDSVDESEDTNTCIGLMLWDAEKDKMVSTSAHQLLDNMASTKGYFGEFLYRWIVQCELQLSPYFLLGTRNSSYDVQLVHLFNVRSQLVPYLKEKFPDLYSRYQELADKIHTVIDWVVDQITELTKDDPNFSSSYAFCFQIAERGNFQLDELTPAEKKAVLNKTLIREFVSWREDHANPLVKSTSIWRNDDQAHKARFRCRGSHARQYRRIH